MADGRILKAQGDSARAIQAYQHAVTTLGTVRRDFIASGSRTSFRESVGPVYFQLADLLLERSGTLTDPKQVTQHLVDARSAVEVLKGAELQDYFQDDCVTALRADHRDRPPRLEHRRALSRSSWRTAWSSCSACPTACAASRARSAPRSHARDPVVPLRLEKRTTHQYLPHAQKLYDWLIRPVAAELEKAGIDTLVIVPDGALRTVPLTALHDGKQFLVERYCPGHDARPHADRSAADQARARQPAAPRAHRVGAGVRAAAVRGGRAPERAEALRRHGAPGPAVHRPDHGEGSRRYPYQIVHIASHGQFDSDVNKTFLLTYDGKIGMNKLEQILGLSKFRTDAVELLTLSACETAAGTTGRPWGSPAWRSRRGRAARWPPCGR